MKKFKNLNFWSKAFVISETMIGIITVIIMSPMISYQLARQKLKSVLK